MGRCLSRWRRLHWQQVMAHTGQQSELPESGRKAQHCRSFLPLKLRGRGQDDVGRAFPCGLSTILVTIRAARVR